MTVDVCADCFSGLGFVQIPIKQKRTRHLTMTGLLAERVTKPTAASGRLRAAEEGKVTSGQGNIHITAVRDDYFPGPGFVQIPPKTKKNPSSYDDRSSGGEGDEADRCQWQIKGGGGRESHERTR